jgi:hypothetical protein
MSNITAGQLETTDSTSETDFPELDDSPVAVASLATFNGNDPAGVRIKDVSSDRVKLFVEEETSKDNETGHVRDSSSLLVSPRGRSTTPQGRSLGKPELPTQIRLIEGSGTPSI